MEKQISLLNAFMAGANSFNAHSRQFNVLIIRILHGLVICAMLASMLPVRIGQAAVLPDDSQGFYQTDDDPATPTASAIVDITDLITATLTLTPTLTATPTVELTPTATITPTQAVETPTPTEPPPAETPDPYPGPVSAPTPEPVTPTPTPEPPIAIDPSQPVTLTISAPASVLPGRAFYMNWTTNAVYLDKETIELALKAPAGLSPAAESAENFNPATSVLSLSLNKSSDGITWQVPADLEGPFTI